MDFSWGDDRFLCLRFAVLLSVLLCFWARVDLLHRLQVRQLLGNLSALFEHILNAGAVTDLE